jgi:cytochrome c5
MPVTQHVFRTGNAIARKMILLLGCLVLCAGCTDERSEPGGEPSTTPAELSQKLSQTFVQTCALCHVRPSTGAPMVGDAEAWAKVLVKGIGPTLERTIQGYGGMPPGGQCFDCTLEELVQLIAFMSQQPMQVQP